MTRFVLDCSTTMNWCFEDEVDHRAESVLAALPTNGATVPSIWPLEVANVLAISERRRRLGAADIVSFVDQLAALPITVDDQAAKNAFGEVLRLARTYRLTAYDAAYLELALRIGCPLASLDAPLNGAASALGIALFAG